MVLVLILAFTIRGLLRGMISEIFAVLGLVVGLWAAGWVSQWVVTHWREAQPAVAFFFLRWMVVLGTALIVAMICRWWGERMKGVVGATPLGFLDRAAGMVLGASAGGIMAAFVVLALLSWSWPSRIDESASRSRMARPLMGAAAHTCATVGRFFPGSDWLEVRFIAAERRAHSRARST